MKNKPIITGGIALVFTALALGQAKDPNEIVTLNPFVVSQDVKGYAASNTISGTAMATPLRDVPMSINVITSEFISDSLVGDMENLFEYNSSVTQTQRVGGDVKAIIFNIRGFDTRNVLLDGSTGGVFLPTYLIDRVEIVKGPNTLYGQSDPGGLINVVSKQAQGSGRGHLGFRAGEQGLAEVEFDYDMPATNSPLRLRVLGAHFTNKGFRVNDGKTLDYASILSQYSVGKKTTVLLNASGNKSRSIPTQRATFAFEQIPTDLNRDGDTIDTVEGLAEATVRYNNTFLPRNYTTATPDSRQNQDTFFLHAGLRHQFSDRVHLQYMYLKTDFHLDVLFREFNTFTPAGVNSGLHFYETRDNTTDAHTLNTFFAFDTGPLKHQLLVGGRYTKDSAQAEGFLLNSAVAADRAVLQSMINRGRRIRLELLKSDVLNGVPYWNDELPTVGEMQAFRSATGNSRSFEDVATFYVTDNAAALDGRLRLLTGLRHIRIKSSTANLQRVVAPGSRSDQRDTSFQVGLVYGIHKHVNAFANYATSFNPNGRDALTGLFFPPQESEAYEAGFKFDDLWSGRLSGTVAWFNIAKNNVVRTDFNPFTFINNTEITNDISRGVEAELFLDITKNWNTIVSYSHLDSKTVASTTLAKNLRLEGAAPHRLTLWTSYAFPQSPLTGLRIGGGLVWAGGPIQQFGTSVNRFVREDGYTEIDLFARYSTKLLQRAVTLGVNINNVNNAFYFRARAATNSPRQVVFSARIAL
jgi:iron complex outermembrane receptor protein